jgi:putative xylitol transport system permease protein
VQVGSAGYNTGSEISIQLQAIACGLIGGTTLTGGKGGVVGSFFAAIFLTVALEGVIVAGIAYQWQSAGVGVLLLVAILIDAYQNRQGRSVSEALRSVLGGHKPVQQEASS